MTWVVVAVVVDVVVVMDWRGRQRSYYKGKIIAPSVRQLPLT